MCLPFRALGLTNDLHGGPNLCVPTEETGVLPIHHYLYGILLLNQSLDDLLVQKGILLASLRSSGWIGGVKTVGTGVNSGARYGDNIKLYSNWNIGIQKMYVCE